MKLIIIITKTGEGNPTENYQDIYNTSIVIVLNYEVIVIKVKVC